MAIIKNFSQLIAEIETRVKNSLDNEVFETVKEEMQKSIDENVYDIYPRPIYPSVYDRRETSSGLIADSNIIGKLNNMDLIIENITITHPTITVNGETRPSKNAGKLLAPIIEYGGQYDFNYPNPPYAYNQPRPFIENTREELKSSKKHVAALKKGLKRQGLKVK